MGINFNRVGDDYVAYGKRGPVFEDGQEVEQQSYQPAVQQPVVKKAEEDPEKGLTVQTNSVDADPVAEYERKAKELLTQSEQTLKNLGIKPKSLEYSGTIEDFKTPQTVDDAKYRYRQMRYNGQIKAKDVKTGELRDLTDAELEEMAKIKIENDKRIKKIENTHVFLDKSEYDKKEGEKNAYIQEQIDKGVPKEKAKADADAKYGVNNYLHGGIFSSKARRFINKHPELFNDENGKFSEKKLKAFVIKAANCLNGDDEEISGFLSLDERRKFKQMLKDEFGVKASVDTIGKLAKAIGMDKEYNPTFLLRTGVVIAATGAGAAVGGAIGGGVAFGTVTTNTCGNVCWNLIEAPAWLIGAGAGAVTGGATTPFLAAKGKPEPHIPAIRPLVTQPAQQPVQQPVETPVEEPPVEVIEPPVETPCDPVKYVVPNGYSIQRISKETGIPIKTIIEMNKKGLHSFYQDLNDCENKKRVYGFRAGQEIQLPCDAKITQHDSKTEVKKYERAVKNRTVTCEDKRRTVLWTR